MLRRPLWLLMLVLFVGMYILSVSTYTYIASLGSVDVSEQVRVKRGVANITENVSEALTESKPETQDKNNNSITLNICCGKTQVLNDKYECVESNASKSEDEYPSKIKLLAEQLVINEELDHSYINLSRLVLNYKIFKEYCPLNEAVVVNLTLERLQTHFISQTTGELVELTEDRQNISTSFSTKSYCIDAVWSKERSFAALLCPCDEKICINKCCQNGYYYNEKDKKCKIADSGNIGAYQPTFYHLKDKIEDAAYFLREEKIKCNAPDRLIKKNINDTISWHIQGKIKGALMLSDEKDEVYTFYDNTKYCLDIFSDESSNQTYINGFYCSDANVKFIYNKSAVYEVKDTTPAPENIFIPQEVEAKSKGRTSRKEYVTYYLTVLAVFSNNIYYLILLLLN